MSGQEMGLRQQNKCCFSCLSDFLFSTHRDIKLRGAFILVSRIHLVHPSNVYFLVSIYPNMTPTPPCFLEHQLPSSTQLEQQNQAADGIWRMHEQTLAYTMDQIINKMFPPILPQRFVAVAKSRPKETNKHWMQQLMYFICIIAKHAN